MKLLGIGAQASENNLHWATEGVHEDILYAQLLRDPQLSNCQNTTSKELPVLVAVEYGRVDILRVWLMNGTRNLVYSLNSINIDLTYQSSLHLAVDGGDLVSVKVLLEARENVNLRGKDSNLNITPLQLAAKDRRIEILDELIAHYAMLDDALYP